MRELTRPAGIDGDSRATEMIRVWLAHDNLHVSLRLGMWQDSEDCVLDERDTWGELLADVVRHIANGLAQSHGWKTADTMDRIRESFLSTLSDPDRDVEGGYTE
jgi:hypothetical protein